MKFLFLFTTLLLASLTQARILQNNPYCDQWTPCPQGDFCWENKCVTEACSGQADCQMGFECTQGKCSPLTQPSVNGPYCDQWTPCANDQQCINKKCVPLSCNKNTDCPQNFQCFSHTCILPEQHGQILGYCDIYTPCPLTHQCINKQCYPYTCNLIFDCAEDFLCWNGEHCILKSPFKIRGRDCGIGAECDLLHECVNGECVWK